MRRMWDKDYWNRLGRRIRNIKGLIWGISEEKLKWEIEGVLREFEGD